MSKNIHQIFVANPATSMQSTDLMYLGRSPYGATDDFAITYANFSSVFAPSVLTTKGDLYTFSTVNARLAVGTTNGQILQVASGATTGLAWSTASYPTTTTINQLLYSSSSNVVAGFASAQGAVLATDGVSALSWVPNPSASNRVLLSTSGAAPFWSNAAFPLNAGATGTILRSNGTDWIASTATFADTYTASNLLYSNGTNTVTGLSTTNNASLSTNATGVPTWLALTDGQVVIGSSAGAPLAANLTAGTGVSISNGHNTITISSSGAEPWVDETGASVTMTANTGYTSDDGASLVTFTLPATAAIGDWIEINGKGAGGWTLIEGTGQIIHFGNQTTTITTGSLSSTNQWDCVKLRCVTANTTFTVVSAVGNLTVV